MINNYLNTVTLRSGAVVLARPTKYGLEAYKYANRTSAEKKAREVGGVAGRTLNPLSRPFFVFIGGR